MLKGRKWSIYFYQKGIILSKYKIGILICKNKTPS